MTTFRSLAATLVIGVAATAVTASAFAQVQFRDEKTGKVWTPDNVSKDNGRSHGSDTSGRKRAASAGTHSSCPWCRA